MTTKRIVETRTRTETRTGHRTVHHADGTTSSETYTYEVEVEYEYYILNVTLTNNGISAAVTALNLTQEQMERYTLLLETRGNKPDIFGDNVYANGKRYVICDPTYIGAPVGMTMPNMDNSQAKVILL